jgi:hypothetical protein
MYIIVIFFLHTNNSKRGVLIDRIVTAVVFCNLHLLFFAQMPTEMVDCCSFLNDKGLLEIH